LPDPSLDFQVLPDAELMVLSGADQEGIVGRPLAERLVTLVVDASGQPLAGAPVTWTFGAGSGGKRGARGTVVTLASDDLGVVEVEWELGTTSGPQLAWAEIGRASTVDPSVDGAVLAPPENPGSRGRGRRVRFQAMADPGEAAAILVSHASLELEVGETVTLTAVVVDQYGNGIPDAEITWWSADSSVVSVQEPAAVPTPTFAALPGGLRATQGARPHADAASSQ
jgi:hypothetical protein